jgi:hypothetical protein
VSWQVGVVLHDRFPSLAPQASRVCLTERGAFPKISRKYLILRLTALLMMMYTRPHKGRDWATGIRIGTVADTKG